MLSLLRIGHAMSNPVITAAMVPALISLAVAAGQEVLAVYATDFDVMRKADASSVTDADHRAEAVILAGLAKIAPGIPVVAEEEAAAGRVPETEAQFFLVDPLDGTREFICRNGEFTVNIALIENGISVMGVVYAPALGTLYAGTLGVGAVKAQVRDGVAGPLEPITARAAPREKIAAIGSRANGADATQAWLARLPIGSFVSAGSSLKFCLLAEGAADVYPRLGRTMEWDTAAGDAVLAAAGGIVTQLDGARLLYGKCRQTADAPYANPHFVAYGDPRLAKAVADLPG